MKPIESMSLSEILSTKVDQDRIERLKKLTRPDVPEDTAKNNNALQKKTRHDGVLRSLWWDRRYRKRFLFS
jgi:hypothetical protein